MAENWVYNPCHVLKGTVVNCTVKSLDTKAPVPSIIESLTNDLRKGPE